jgi:CheY-like chemotaxis protein
LMAKVQEGEISFVTSDAEGTTVSVQLRAAPEGHMAASDRHADSESSALSLLHTLPPMRALLVDDDEYNLMIVSRFLDAANLTLDTATNGRAALEMAARDVFDVLVMDLDMPVMGGMEAIAKMREQERRLGSAPMFAIALSSHDDGQTNSNALAAGFDDYVCKPVTREKLERALLNVAERLVAPRS